MNTPQDSIVQTGTDTLEIPFYLACPEQKDTASVPYPSFGEMECVQENTSWRQELAWTGPRGRYAEERPFQIWQDDAFCLLFLFCFLLLSYLKLHNGLNLGTQARTLLFSVRENTKENYVKTSIERSSVPMLNLICSFSIGVLFYHFASTHGETTDPSIQHPLTTVGAVTAGTFCYFLLKGFLYRFVNTFFFNKTQCVEWKESLHFSEKSEAILFFLCAILIGTPYAQNLSYCAVLALLILFFIKGFLFYQGFRIFFRQTYCALHLILYLCAMEISPIMLLTYLLLKTRIMQW